MSNEIKMSDVFKLPLHFNIEICEINQFGCAVEAVPVNKDHILHAINSHDQHLARIAELESALNEIVNEAQCYEQRSGKSVSWTSNAKQLLEQSK